MGKRLRIPIKRKESKKDYDNGQKVDMRPRRFRFTKYGKQYLALMKYSESEISMRIATYRGTLEEVVAQVSMEYGLIKDADYTFEREKIKPKKINGRRWNAIT
ncbi:hypothetical protein HYT25_03270 [Candidatus Pacearchaeota archaeon]|nr:hypothetical protein [Candidatus Pacearchaeota archaeon]